MRVASPASDKVVFSPSFSFSEALYRVLYSTLHKTTSEPPAPHEIRQLAGGCTHTNTGTHTQRRQVPQFPFPRKPVRNDLIYSLAVSDAPGGKHRGERGWRISELIAAGGLMGWMGQNVRRGGWGNMNKQPGPHQKYGIPAAMLRHKMK